MSTDCGNNGGANERENDAASTGCGNIRDYLSLPCDGVLRVRCPQTLIEAAARRAGERGESLGSYARRAVAAALQADAIRERAAAARSVATDQLFTGD